MFGNNNIWCSSYITESDVTTEKLTLDYNLPDGEMHTYRFDWYEGEKVEFYVDGVLITTITTNVPTHSMKVWIGAWCPDWSGTPTNEASTMQIESFKYTPFEE